MERGTNRTLMWVVREGTPGLSFECAECISGSIRWHSFIVCNCSIVSLKSSVFILSFL